MKRFLVKFDIVLVILFSALITILFTWPGILNLSSRYIGDGYDNYEYASYQSLAAQRITSGQLPFGFTNFWRYPVGFDFGRGFDSYLTVSTGAFLKLFLGMPLSYNLTIYILLILNGLFSYIFFRYLTGSKSLGLIGAIIYGFSFYALARGSSHPNLMFEGGIPLLFLAVIRLIKKEVHELKDYLLLFLSLILIALGSSQYLLMVFILFPIYALLALFFYKREAVIFIKKIRIGQFLLSLAIFMVTLLLLFYPHIQAVFNKTFVFLARKDVLFASTPSALDYIFPNTYLKLFITNFFHSNSDTSIEKVVFLGFTEILLFIASLIGFLRLKSKKNTLFLITLLIVPLLLSLGFGKYDNLWPLPYHFLGNLFPFSLVPETGRFYVFFYFFLTSVILLFLKNLNIKNKTLLLILIIVFVIAERLPTKFYLAPALKNDAFAEIVKTQKTNAVLDIPVNFYYSPYDILSFSYEKPIVNGYFHWSADGDSEKKFILQDNLLSRYICSNEDPITNKPMDNNYEANQDLKMLSVLKENNIKTIVIHKDNKFLHPVCTNVRKRLSRLFQDYSPIDTTTIASEKQVIKTSLPGEQNFTFYLPYNGKFYPDGVYVAPTNKADFNIYINNQRLTNYSWSIAKNNSMEFSPKDSISISVKAGSSISFSSSNETGSTYFSMWYRYVANTSSGKITREPFFQKIFEDDKAVIYRLK